MSSGKTNELYLGQPVWIVTGVKVNSYFIASLDNPMVVTTTKEPGPETLYRIASDFKNLFTNEVEAIEARQDVLRMQIHELKHLLEQGLIEKCDAERREDAAKKTRRKSAEHDDTPSL